MADFDLKNFSFNVDEGAFNFGGPESMDEGDADPGIFLPNTEGRTEFLPPDAERVPKIPGVVDNESADYAERPAAERTAELFNNMNPHRRVLYGVLRAMNEPLSDAQADEAIEALRAHKFSVYSPADICTMLATAGAVTRVLADGTPYEEFEPEPKIVVIDGVEYWEAQPAPEHFWLISDAGRAQLASYDPAEKLTEQLAREPEYAKLYKRILVLGSEEGGKTMKQFSAAVDNDPLVATEPRSFFVQHFVEALERCEAVAWFGSTWKTTDVGRAALAGELSDVVDDYVPDESAQPAETETDGVNW